MSGEAVAQLAVRVLLIDDDASILRTFRYCLEDLGYKVVTATTPGEAEAALARDVIDVCLLDVNLGEVSGLDLLPRLRAEAPWLRVVMATAEDSVDMAVRALRAGAADYLVKPCSPDQLAHAVGQQAEARRLERRLESLGADAAASSEVDFATRSSAVEAVFEAARQVASTDATILILGESGTGKNVLARAIHNWSHRSQATFATVSCPSLSPELLESELFGHVKGAFTGATENRQGRVQVADGGTLLLDEVGDLPLALQPKLLRFLQDKEYERVGDPHTRRADVRVLAATNRDLSEMVKQGTFREDLFYRLNVITLAMPPLRERVEDVVGLAERMLGKFALQYKRPARRFNAEAAALLVNYDWPGNLRELRNAIERAAIICGSETVGTEHLPMGKAVGGGRAPQTRVGAPVTLEALERAHIEAVVSASSTLEAAARTLGIDASTLYRKRKQFEVKTTA